MLRERREPWQGDEWRQEETLSAGHQRRKVGEGHRELRVVLEPSARSEAPTVRKELLVGGLEEEEDHRWKGHSEAVRKRQAQPKSSF